MPPLEIDRPEPPLPLAVKFDALMLVDVPVKDAPCELAPCHSDIGQRGSADVVAEDADAAATDVDAVE